MNSPQDRALHPLLICMLRNLMSRLPEYAWLSGRLVLLNPKDGRARLDMEEVKTA